MKMNLAARYRQCDEKKANSRVRFNEGTKNQLIYARDSRLA